MEKLTCKRLYNFLEVHKILYEFQFGFRKHHSTILALMKVLDNIYHHLDRHKQNVVQRHLLVSNFHLIVTLQ